MGKGNRNYKANVFSHLFGEPAAELELFNSAGVLMNDSSE
jgi:hypothetical protein